MLGKYRAVFGIYPIHTGVEQGVDALRLAGFHNSDISVLCPENTDSGDLTQKKNNKSQDGASVGGWTGAIVGGVVGWLVGMALTLPDVGDFLAAGSILAALVGAGVGGIVGEIARALIGIGMPEDEAKRHKGRAMRSGIPLFVHPQNSEWANRAKEILKQTGARNISSTDDVIPEPVRDRLVVREVA